MLLNRQIGIDGLYIMPFSPLVVHVFKTIYLIHILRLSISLEFQLIIPQTYVQVTPKFTGYSVKIPRAAQPDLDYIAPEAQLYNSMSPLADMFSLGMVVCALHNKGHSLIDSEQNPSVYVKRIPEVTEYLIKCIVYDEHFDYHSIRK
ncbi:unnamed protein product [Trichobilharzia regenti]|nr:unnamed protein product [Trichobilharzia regenti]